MNSIDSENEKLSKKMISECINALNNNQEDFTSDEYHHMYHLARDGHIEDFQKIFLKRVFDKNSTDTKPSSSKIPSPNTSEFLKEIESNKEVIKKYASLINRLESEKSETHKENKKLTNEVELHKKLIEKSLSKIHQLENEKSELQSQIQQTRIDEKIPGYVDNVKSELDLDDSHFISMSRTWAISGCLFALAAVFCSFYTLYLHIDFTTIKSIELVYVFTRGLIGITILSWLAYICLSNAKKYTHESIRRKDRRHALMFGQVFLQIYGSTATKEDAILVFKDWNMSGDSAFSDRMEQPPGIQTLLGTAREKLKAAVIDKSSE